MNSKLIKILFWSALGFIFITVFSFTIGQSLPYEFENYKVQQKFYDTIIFGLPFAVVLTLFGTIKKKNSNWKNWLWFGSTILVAILCFIGQIFMILSFGFGSWTTETTIYKHKSENTAIKKQLYDIGAFGYGGQRTVIVEPFLIYWIRPTEIDTQSINKQNWIYINEEGDMKFP